MGQGDQTQWSPPSPTPRKFVTTVRFYCWMETKKKSEKYQNHTGRGHRVKSDVSVKTSRGTHNDAGPAERKESAVSAVHSSGYPAFRNRPVGEVCCKNTYRYNHTYNLTVAIDFFFIFVPLFPPYNLSHKTFRFARPMAISLPNARVLKCWLTLVFRTSALGVLTVYSILVYYYILRIVLHTYVINSGEVCIKL